MSAFLGYDLRVKRDENQFKNRPYSKEQTLVDRPYILSADPAVWLRIDEFDRRSSRELGSTNPFNLAKDLTDLESAAYVNSECVALTCHQAVASALEERWGPGWFESDQTDARFLEPEWSFMGFDVLDVRGLISGLAGCGYKPSLKARLQEQFESCINDVGLFDDFLSASIFAEVRSLQIPAHSPFITFGIHVKN